MGKVLCHVGDVELGKASGTNVGSLEVACDEFNAASLAWEMIATDQVVSVQPFMDATELGSVACGPDGGAQARAALAIQVSTRATLREAGLSLHAELKVFHAGPEPDRSAVTSPVCVLSVGNEEAKFGPQTPATLSFGTNQVASHMVRVTCAQAVERGCGGAQAGSLTGLSGVRVELRGIR